MLHTEMVSAVLQQTDTMQVDISLPGVNPVADHFGDVPTGVDPAMWRSLDAETAAALLAAMFEENSEDEGGGNAI